MMKLFAELRRRNVLRVAGTFLVGSWFLVQMAFTLESVMNLPEWFDAIFMALLILGLPVAIILAWAFELTPEGFKRTAVVNEADSIAAKTGKKLDIAILIGFALIAGLLIMGQFRGGSSGATKLLKVDGSSVAVLPFENRSADLDNAYFADGIHDELLTALSKVDGLDVISRTSVMGYRNTEKRIPEIAAELGAAAVLEGAVQKSGERVRITVQLIDGANDTHIWANNYDRALTTENIFDIQGEITNVIAASLKDVLGGNLEVTPLNGPTDNLAAFEAYIKAKLQANPGNPVKDDLIKALALYDQAVSLDPNFAEGWARKAYTHMALYWFHGRDQADLALAVPALDNAKRLSPNALDTLVANAFYHYWGEADFRAANDAFDQALRVAPGDVEAIAGKAFITRRLGNFEESLAGLEKAHRLDPLSYYLIPELGLTYALLGRAEEAKAMMEKARDMDPQSLQGAGFRAAVAQFRGDADAAYEAFKPVAAYLPSVYVNYALATRDEAKARAAMKAWPDDRRQSDDDKLKYAYKAWAVADAFGDAAEKEAATDALRAFYDPTETWRVGQAISPVILPAILRDTVRLRELDEAHQTFDTDDQLTRLSTYGELAGAFAEIGDQGRAMDYIEQMEALTGPHILLVLENDMGLDGLRDHPRYKALQARYARIAP
ncbi:tetratricopeptide repeat protein [Litorimonas sp. RW-G-Af-16]|uniref:tetratricopeptide repeat protein n=1 Tax=Litorimonas sp. RW-G-Af-16 TaxID=3241168 RepID=UPI00390CBE2B